MSKTEEALVTSERRVSGQRQSPGKGRPQPEAGELGNSQEARASGTEETRGKQRRRLSSLTRRQVDKGLPCTCQASCQCPICPLQKPASGCGLTRVPLPQFCPLCEMAGPLLYPQAQGMKERRAGDRQQGKLTARLWGQGDTMLSP